MSKDCASKRFSVLWFVPVAVLLAFLLVCMPAAKSYAVDGSADLVASEFTGEAPDGEKVSIANAEVTLSQTEFTFSPSGAFEPVPVVKVDGNMLSSPSDYTYRYEENTSVGTAHVVIEGAGDYTDSKTVDFVIKPCVLGKSNVTLSSTKYTYTGKAVQPNPVVKYDAKTLVKDVDYTVTYKNNKKLGKATLTVSGKGNYTGGTSKSFTIVLRKGVIAAAKSPNYLSVKATAQKTPGAKKYQFVIGTSKSPSKAVKKVTTTKRSATFKGLKQGKRYYVSVRPLAKVGSKTQYGAWSKPKPVTVKTHAFVGKWSLYSMTVDGKSYSPSQIQGLKMMGLSATITLKKDYTGVFAVELSKQMKEYYSGAQQSGKFTWKATSSTKGSLTATDASSAAMSVKNGLLAITSGSYVMVFKK